MRMSTTGASARGGTLNHGRRKSLLNIASVAVQVLVARRVQTLQITLLLAPVCKARAAHSKKVRQLFKFLQRRIRVFFWCEYCTTFRGTLFAVYLGCTNVGHFVLSCTKNTVSWHYSFWIELLFQMRVNARVNFENKENEHKRMCHNVNI